MNARKLLSAAKAVEAAYIEDVFSTYLYTGNGSTQTITNGIDLSGKDGLVWIKARSAGQAPRLWDTARGINLTLDSTVTTGNNNEPGSLTAFNSNGFSLGSAYSQNTSSTTYVSWTFRKQAKFFDVVTYTGNGANRTISHNLGSVPGCIIVKRTDTTADWQVYHRSIANTEYLVLNTTAAKATGATRWNSTTATSTEFSLGTDTTVNANTGTYVAYLFAHDAGGFGQSGSDNVISCGSYTGNGSTNNVINTGYEAQFVLIKAASGSTAASQNWCMYDVMRGMPTGTALNDNVLFSNLSNAETAVTGDIAPHATGFVLEGNDARVNSSANTYIYIAIRRGPMRVPTSGTSVFAPYAATSPGNAVVTTNFPVDFQMQKNAGAATDLRFVDRLRGVSSTPTSPSAAFPFLVSSDTTAEATGTGTTLNWNNTGFTVGNTYTGGTPTWAANFRRAPGFFDVVCYTGTGSAQTLSHNLGVTPELMIVKWRTGATGDNWNVYHSAIGATGALYLNKTDATVGTAWNNTAPTATQFTVGTQGSVSAATYVAYLFASCPGVSKVGSYTGTGNTLQIDCGFTGGARFVLIKRTDSSGDWYVWDSARGIVAGSDPYLTLNTTAAEVTTTDWVDTYSAGFELSNAGGNNANINTATYIFLAIA